MKNEKKLKLIVGVGIIFLALLTGMDAMESFLNPLKYVHEVTAEPAKYINRNIQVVGLIVEGSWQPGEKPGTYKFKLTDGNATINVEYMGEPPGTLKPDTGVTVIGTLVSKDAIKSSKLLIKCPSKYQQTLSQVYTEQKSEG